MEFINANIEVFKVLGSILASLTGGGLVAYFTLPILVQKARMEIRKGNIETAEAALEVANEATNQAKQANDRAVQAEQKAMDIQSLMEGDLHINGHFSMSDVMKTGEAKLHGTVLRLRKVPAGSPAE